MAQHHTTHGCMVPRCHICEAQRNLGERPTRWTPPTLVSDARLLIEMAGGCVTAVTHSPLPPGFKLEVVLHDHDDGEPVAQIPNGVRVL